jgi:competence protein ComEC
VEPGFQLSFAATLAIVALVEVFWLKPRREQGKWALIVHGIAFTLLISVVAEIATAPLAISQFNTASSYGVFANALATPLVSLVLMPTVVLFFLLLPFGLESLALTLMGWGIAALSWLAHFVSSLPYAQWFVLSIPDAGMALFAIGLLMSCLLVSRVRWVGLGCIAVGVSSLALVTPPSLIVGSELKQIAFREGDSYVLARGRSDAMIAELWANGLGQAALPMVLKESPHWRCDGLGCVATISDKPVAFPKDPLALQEDCARAALVVTSLSRVKCRSDARLITGGRLARGGIHAVWIKDDDLRIESSRDWQGDRLWSVYR